MSYLKLDRTKINYISPKKTSPGMILSQVISSECSPGSPKLISTTQELDIFFGKSFPEREYFEELLSGDVTLLLTTPKKPDSLETPVLDISGFQEITEVIDKFSEKNIPLEHSDQLPKAPEDKEGREYRDFLEEVTGKKYYVSGESEYYIFYQDAWVSKANLPVQVLPGSTTNRDTLRLNASGWSESEGFSWCWPKYSSPEWIPDYPEAAEVEEISESLLSSIHGTEDWSGKSIGYTLDFTRAPEDGLKPGDPNSPSYLVFPVSDNRMIQFYLGKNGYLTSDTLGSFRNVELTGNRGDMVWQILNDNLKADGGWRYTGLDGISGLVYGIYNQDVTPDLEFYNIPGVSFKASPRVSHNVLSILSEPWKRVEFYSKTFGPGTEDINLQVTKVKGKLEWYRLIISRYDYQEVFEGPLYLEVTEEDYYNTYTSLEKIVNQGSKLVEMRVFKDGFSKDNPDHGLPEGEYTLSGATSPGPWEPEDYWRGLDDLLEFGVSEDFLMIPRVEDYLKTGVLSGESWYSEYKSFLKYATEKNCQVLVSNHPWYFGCETFDSLDDLRTEKPEEPKEKHLYLIKSGENITAEVWDEEHGWKYLADKGGNRWKEITETLSPGYTGNQIFNYQIKDDTGKVIKDLDPDNRLVYFYRDMTLLGWWRPAWYIFLRGLLSGGYTPEVTNILYDSPAKYYTEDEEPGERLEGYKSNFLSENGHIFYYRRLFSGSTPVTSILSRFVMDKVSGTVSREFPAYLGKETTGEIIRGLQGILSGLKLRYSLIHSLEISRMEENLEKQMLSVYLDLGIRETLDKDIKLSVTLNFNFN